MHTTRIQVNLVADDRVRRSRVWIDLPEVLVRAYGRRDFVPETHLSPDIPLLLYQVDDRYTDTLRFLDQAFAMQSDLCTILLGPERGADQVARMLRHGAFDYLVWPCPPSRLHASMADGLVNRRTFIEVRNLSSELAATNQMLAQDREMLTRWNRNLSLLNELTQTLAGSLDSNVIVKTLFASLRQLFGADLIGLIKTHPEHLWIWSHGPQRAREAQLRLRLLGRPGMKQAVNPAPKNGGLHLVLPPSLRGRSPLIESRSIGALRPVATCAVPLTIGPQDGLLHIERDGGDPFSEQEQQLLATVGASVALSLRNADAYQQAYHLALRDPLTDVLNRRALEGPLNREVSAGLRYGTTACLMLLDLDYFKTVNDRLGHLAGDEVLRQVARLIQETVRDLDSVGRYGGEEFAVVLPHTGLDQAQALAERLRARLERHAFDLPDGQVRVTASIGLAPLLAPDVTTAPEWIAAADAALYAAKARGRNCVVAHAPHGGAPVQAAVLCMAA